MLFKKLYRVFIAPRETEAKARGSELTLNVLVAGTLIMACFTLGLLGFHYVYDDQAIALSRLVACSAISLFFLGLLVASRRGHYRGASYFLILIYYLIVLGMVVLWSVQIPQGVLLAAFVVILSGVVLGSRYAVHAAILMTVTMLGAFFFTHPDTEWKQSPPSSADVVVFGITFGLIAAVCWLYNTEIERSLRRAEKSERALRRQKDLLEVKVEQRTKKLQAVQLQQIQQVYRFAELGLVSTALLHDLANHMSTISLDIAGLEDDSGSDILKRIRRTIGYIDNSVQNTRDQLHGDLPSKRFSVTKSLDEVISLLHYRANQRQVQLTVDNQLKRPVRFWGDEMRFKQLLTNIIANGIDASGEVTAESRRKTIVTVSQAKGKLIVAVTDFGKGVAEQQKERIFAPFYTTKKQGMGLGLFTSKEIAERTFAGKITIQRGQKHGTVFSIIIPLKKT